jgi:fructose-bisphosphate aldolase class I
MTDLLDIAKKMVAPGKGILAADESTLSADKRLALYGIEGTEENRRKNRDLFLNAPGVETYLSGVILYTETLSQKGNDGVPFTKSLSDRGIIPGIKVDEGTEPFPESPDELITKGVLGLCERLSGFHDTYHTSFTKWRAVVRIDGDRLPSAQALVENAKRLATYARDVQEVHMVPIIEPEVLYEGNHSRVRARQVLEATLKSVFDALADQSVDLSGVILKTSMVLSGSESGRTDTPEEVANDTIEVLMANVPAHLPGIVFLSGGQTPDQATENLCAIAKAAREKGAPWPLTFSFARALQEEALELWAGKDENIPAARAAFLARLEKVSEALAG